MPKFGVPELIIIFTVVAIAYLAYRLLIRRD